MSDKHTQIESVELSENDLDNVAGGTGYDPHKHMGGFAAGVSTATAAAVGGTFAATVTNNDSFAISQPHIQAAGSKGSSISSAAT